MNINLGGLSICVVVMGLALSTIWVISEKLDKSYAYQSHPVTVFYHWKDSSNDSWILTGYMPPPEDINPLFLTSQ